MPAPLEIFAGPFTAWLAVANTAEPLDLDTAPVVAWSKLGANGSLNYDEDGVTISNDEAIEYFRGLGGTGRRKAWRTEEDLMVSLKVYDLTAEAMAIATGNTMTTVAAGASISGAKTVGLNKGPVVKTNALLLRSDSGSPYGDTFKTQLWIPVVSINSVGDIVFSKGEPAGLELEFAAMYDPTDGFGKFRAQTAVKTS